MATTQVRTNVGSTGASGANGFTGLVAAHNTAIASAVTTAQGVTGCVIASINITPTIQNQDALGGIWTMLTGINYITQTA